MFKRLATLFIILLTTAALVETAFSSDIKLVRAEAVPTKHAVRLFIKPSDDKGKFVYEIDASDLAAKLDGRPARIKQVSPQRLKVGGLAIALLVDVSGSMRGKRLEKVRTLANPLMRSLKKGDQVAVLSFEKETETIQPFTSDVKTALESLKRIEAKRNGMALYDAIETAVSLLAQAKQKTRTIILLTDSSDEGSKLTDDDAVRLLYDRRIPLHAVWLGAGSPGEFLDRASLMSGGTSTPTDVSDPPGILVNQVADSWLVELDAPTLVGKSPGYELDWRDTSGKAAILKGILSPPPAPSRKVARNAKQPANNPKSNWPLVPLAVGGAALIVLGSAYSRFRRNKQARALDGHGEINGYLLASSETVLVVNRGPNAGRSYPVSGTALIIGRGRHSDIKLLDDPGVSRKHARVARNADGVYTVTDLDSTNGILVNGEKVEKTELGDGDVVTVGDTSLLFRVTKSD